MFTKQQSVTITAAIVLSLVSVLILATLFLSFKMEGMGRETRYLFTEVDSLQQRLISAEITSSKLDQVQKLIRENMTNSEQDSLAQGASLQFLKALTQTLDKLKITLVTLEPMAPSYNGTFMQTPYRMIIECTYEQLCELENRMEKSSRLISLTEFTIENHLEEFYNSGGKKKDVAMVSLELSTLTLVRE